MPLTHENIKLFLKLFNSYEESSHKGSKIFPFPVYVLFTLIKSKLQIHLANPTNPDILKFITKFS